MRDFKGRDGPRERKISVDLEQYDGCPFRKLHPVWIRIVRQNHRIIESDVYNPARARNARRGSIQVANPA